MIVVKVELYSAITGQITEIGRMHISNDGTGTNSKGNYQVEQMRKNSKNVVVRRAQVFDHPRLSKSIWILIFKALVKLGYET